MPDSAQKAPSFKLIETLQYFFRHVATYTYSGVAYARDHSRFFVWLMFLN